MSSLSPVLLEIQAKILKAVWEGAASSCEAVQWTLPWQYVESYREHSRARKNGYGFHDIPPLEWHSNYTRDDRTRVRLTRLQAWFDSLECPSATQKIPPHTPWMA